MINNPIHIGTQEIHLWILPIKEVPIDILPILNNLLTEEEKNKKAKFIFEKDRKRFLLTRLFIRQLLASYLSIDPLELKFSTNPYGRPELEAPIQPIKVNFNLSHTKDMIICGLVTHGQIGVDTEDESRKVERGIVKSFFSKIEQDSLAQLDGKKHARHFWQLWTLKEAYIKARGKGLLIPLDSFGFYDFQNSQLQFWEKDKEKGEKWFFYSFFPVYDHRIACAWNVLGPRAIVPQIKVRKFLPLEPVFIEALNLEIANQGVAI